jgi:hypothetical protein
MWFGIGLVLVGVALIVLLVRRNRADRVDEHASAYPQVPLTRSAGGTTYRSGAPAGQVYGQQPTPTVYGGNSSPRPVGTVYGAPSASQPAGEPPAAAGGDATSVLPHVSH